MDIQNKEILLKEVEDFLGQSLNKKDDLQCLLDLSFQFDLTNSFEKIAFTGKYLNGLMKVLKSGVNIPEVESLDHVKKDLTLNLESLINQLREIISNSDEQTITRFEKNYLQLNQQNLSNLNLLIEDLDRVKKYLNFKKRKN